MPFFEKIVKGCFVRIGIGQHEGRMVYRVSLQCITIESVRILESVHIHDDWI